MSNETDTRKHYSVPMTVTVKVADGAEAAELVTALGKLLQTVKGVSFHFPPQVGVPMEIGKLDLSDSETAALAEMGAMLDENTCTVKGCEEPVEAGSTCCEVHYELGEQGDATS